MMPIPREAGLEHTLTLKREGYAFATKRFGRLATNRFTTRLLLRRRLVARGAGAARALTDPTVTTRTKAQLLPAKLLLHDRGTVQTLDGDEHLVRKRLIMSLLDDAGVQSLADTFAALWRARIPQWERSGDKVDLLAEVRELLCRAACAWAGVRLDEREVGRRTGDLALLVDASGRLDPRLLRARIGALARHGVDRAPGRGRPGARPRCAARDPAAEARLRRAGWEAAGRARRRR